MEELEELLKKYNLDHLDDLIVSPWSEQYCITPFPKYWQITYQIMSRIPSNKRVVEIGCGQGDVTAIFCQLGFSRVSSYEKAPLLAVNAKRRLNDLFGRENIVSLGEYPAKCHIECDVLVLVNCVYDELVDSKVGYKKILKDFYKYAGNPQYFIMEVIDSSYTIEDEVFPKYLRLSHKDVDEMFPNFQIKSWQTYKYPQNKKSKTLYLIEKK